MRVHLSVKRALLLVCVLYTVLTISSSGLGLLSGNTTDTHAHILMRFAIVGIGIASIFLFRLFPGWSLLAIYVFHYAVTMAAVFLFVWVSGFFIALHPNAYRDVFLNFSAVYVVLAAVIQYAYSMMLRRKQSASQAA